MKNEKTNKSKRYYTIGEVAKLLELEPHVLRFWEKEFKRYIKPLRLSGRRLYPSEQIEVFKKIKTLLYEEGYTIAGAKKKLSTFQQESSYDFKKILIEIRDDLLKLYRILNKN
ncbi:regulatory protein MerR [Thermodesulfatator indicus DSM 15286]|uniref:Regulatory protein MerR n=1 Tax=Thermodesulfatator indicus (strain DSM 15286 / JCM 11887 / CIR29812) TaxID=667014 RepID=F8AAU8_THEID|nr:MerR family transcriptional regulator [Thermodesulfatator indicus]AEH45459.1 regulatory protein MerR [Thermodesulfatator indicus DSM 15286]